MKDSWWNQEATETHIRETLKEILQKEKRRQLSVNKTQ